MSDSSLYHMRHNRSSNIVSRASTPSVEQFNDPFSVDNVLHNKENETSNVMEQDNEQLFDTDNHYSMDICETNAEEPFEKILNQVNEEIRSVRNGMFMEMLRGRNLQLQTRNNVSALSRRSVQANRVRSQIMQLHRMTADTTQPQSPAPFHPSQAYYITAQRTGTTPHQRRNQISSPIQTSISRINTFNDTRVRAAFLRSAKRN